MPGSPMLSIECKSVSTVQLRNPLFCLQFLSHLALSLSLSLAFPTSIGPFDWCVDQSNCAAIFFRYSFSLFWFSREKIQFLCFLSSIFQHSKCPSSRCAFFPTYPLTQNDNEPTTEISMQKNCIRKGEGGRQERKKRKTSSHAFIKRFGWFFEFD